MSATREERFTAFVVEHGDAITRFVRRRHREGDATSVDDVVADVLATCWRRVDDLPDGEEIAYAFGIARNVLANARRRAGRRAAIGATLRPVRASASAELEAIADVTVRAALGALRPSEREVLLLAAFEGLSPDQCARVLGVSTNAAAIRLTRAKTAFAAALDALEESPDPMTTGAR